MNFQIKNFRTFILLAGFLTLPNFVLAAPSISNTSGSFMHGQSVMVSGSGFGVKNPAAPVVWDDGSGKADGDPMSAGGWVTSGSGCVAGAGISNPTYYHTKYRAVPFRGTAGPNPFTTHYLAGAALGSAYSCTGVDVEKKLSGNNPSNENIYMHFDWRLDPNFTYGAENNYKNIMYYAGYPYVSSGSGYYAMFTWNPGHNNDGWIAYTPLRQIDPALCGTATGGYCFVNGFVYGKTDWSKTELVGQINGANSSVNLYENGSIVFPSPGVDLSNFTVVGADGYRTFLFGGFMRPDGSGFSAEWVNQPYINNFRYMANLYADNTWARVLACTGTTWDNHGKCEPQIPHTTWDNGQLQINVNQGSFADNATAYLYVVDANGDANAAGYSVTFGGAGDTTAPSAPSGLSIM